MSLPLTRRIARAALLVAAGAAAGVGAAGSASAAPELPTAPNLGGLTALDGANVGDSVDGAAQKLTGTAGDTGGKAVTKAVPTVGKTGGKAVKKAAPARGGAGGGPGFPPGPRRFACPTPFRACPPFRSRSVAFGRAYFSRSTAARTRSSVAVSATRTNLAPASP